MNRINTIVGALLALVAVSAGAQQAPQPQSEPKALPAAATLPPDSPAAPTSAGAVIIKYKVEMLDKDKDGKVSRVEAAGDPDLVKAFDKLDRDRDGKLNQVELDAFTK